MHNPSTLLVIDNGTWECRAGDAGKDPAMRFRNQIFRIKGKDGSVTYSLTPNKKTSTATVIKSMFDGTVVYNYYVFEGTIREILKNMKQTGKEEPKDLVITECFLNPKMFQDLALGSIFESFGFERVQLGYDFIYSYEYNLKENKKLSVQKDGFRRDFCDVIVSMGHLGVYVVPVDPIKKSILFEKSTYLSLGGHAAQYIFSKSIINKYCGTGTKVSREEVDEYFKKIRIPLDYLSEIEEVVHKGVGNVKIHQKPTKHSIVKIPPKRKMHTQDTGKKKKLVVEEAETAETEDLEEIEIEQETETPIEQETEDSEETAKRLRREKLIKGATDHRNKQKIIKVLERLKYHIFILEDSHLLITDRAEFMQLRKDRLEQLEKTLKKRTFVRNELKNKKSMHSLALLKRSLSQSDQLVEDNVYLQEIKDAAGDDLEIQGEIDYIDMFLRENDDTYIRKEENPLDKIRDGYKEKGGININIEFIRTGEALFNPSIVGIDQPGIGESLSYVFHSLDVRNVFITGGFSQIEGIAERIKKEIESLRYFPNDPVVSTALDPVNDAYRGGFLGTEYFKTYTRKDYLDSI